MSIEEQVAILRCMALEDCQDCLAAMSEEHKAEILDSMQQLVQGQTPTAAAHDPTQPTEAQLLNMQTERADALRQVSSVSLIYSLSASLVPSPSHSLALSLSTSLNVNLRALPSERLLLRQTLGVYYKQHAPEEIGKVENLVARVVGGPPSEVGGMVVGGVLWEEEELFGKIESRYGAKVEVRG